MTYAQWVLYRGYKRPWYEDEPEDEDFDNVAVKTADIAESAKADALTDE